MNIQSIIPLALLCLVLAGCTTEPIKTRISCSPPHAKIWVDGKFVGTTPLQVYMATNLTYHVRAEKEGYLPAETNSAPVMNRRFSSATFGERLVLGLALVPFSGFLATEDKTKYTGHEPVEFILQSIGNTNLDGVSDQSVLKKTGN